VRPLLGDGIEGMRSLLPGSVDLVLTDLPSGRTRAPCDTPVDLAALFLAAYLAVRESGAVVVVADSFDFAQQVRAAGGSLFRYDIIWSKTRATGFLNASKQPLRSHEFVLVFAAPGHWYEPQMSEGHTPIHANTGQGGHGDNYGKQGRVTKARAGATDRFPVSVLHTTVVGTTDPTRTHPQQKPPALLEWLVRSYCPPDGLVCDPCAGSGSTLRAAEACGRRGIGWDVSGVYGVRTAPSTTQSCP